MFGWVIENSIVAGIFALFVFGICRLIKGRPALCHTLWLLVLVRLILPPLPVPSFTVGLKQQVLDLTWNRSQAEDWEWKIPSDAASANFDHTPSPGPHLSNRDMAISPALPGAALISARTMNPAIAHPAEKPSKKSVQSSIAKASGNARAAQAQNPPMALADPADPNSFSSLSAWTLKILYLAWGLVSLMIFCRLTYRVLSFQRQVGAASPAPPDLVAKVHEIATSLGMPNTPIKVLAGIKAPMVWSMGKPVILWPAWRADQELAPGDLPVLAHELAHLARKDHWVTRLLLAAVVVFWWHPLFQIARSRIEHYAEIACDAWAVWAFPRQRRAFADALIEAVAPIPHYQPALATLGAVSHDRQFFKRRLVMIMKGQIQHRTSWRWVGLATLLLCLFLPSWLPAPAPNPQLEPVQGSLGIDAEIESLAKAEIAFQQGQRFYRAGEWQKAAERYRTALPEHPENEGLFGKIGAAELKAGRVQEAIAAFETQVDLAKNKAEPLFDLARARAIAGQAAALDDLDQAIESGFFEPQQLADEAFARFEDNPRFNKLVQKALKVSKLWHDTKDGDRGDSSQSQIDRYQQLLKLTPSNGRAYAALGYAQIKAGDYSDAIDSFQKQLELGHAPERAMYNLACSHALAGNTKAGISALEKAVELGFDDGEHIIEDEDLDNLRGLSAYKDLMERIKTPNWKDSAFLSDPSQWEGLPAKALDHLYQKLGYKALKTKDYVGAAAAFKGQILEGRKNVDRALYNLACSQALLGDSNLALNYLDAAVKAGFDNSKHISEDDDLASLHNEPRFMEIVKQAEENRLLSRFKAISWDHLMTKANDEIRANPKDGKGYHHLGWSYFGKENWQAAMKAFQTQAQLGYSETTAFYNLACCQTKLGNTDQAFVWLDRAIEAGFQDRGHLLSDSDLAPLRDDSRFMARVSKMKGKHKAKHKYDNDNNDFEIDFDEDHAHED